MASDATDSTDHRGDPRTVGLLFVVLTAAGMFLLLSQGTRLAEAISTAFVLALPFAAYAWFVGWGGPDSADS